ncbi:MAG: exodeoxyribonuclease VII large subunit [Gammaproteobacteria bacterium]|nr:exodeoxyribonuclease VII large subunit [Gammaproteobacteria bacterium]
MSAISPISNSESEYNNSSPERIVYSVSQLARDTKNLLADVFPKIWIEGEVSNLAQPGSGHLYFSLKDDNAQIRCAMFRSAKNKLDFLPDNGDQVLVKAQVSLYEARGDFQLIIEHMEQAGDGALRRAFEALKQRLLKEGLFNAEHKQTIPEFPHQIGVITSPTGAAIQDILAVIKRRFPALPIIIYPTRVQGERAAQEIAAALKQADQHGECDVLILARGGGSLEDLWAFNEEIVAYALHNLKTPVITGIGHETDTTIADFVADLRAATPSAAAETISPDQTEWLLTLTRYEDWLTAALQSTIQTQTEALQWFLKRLYQFHPTRHIHNQFQRLDELEIRLSRSVTTLLDKLAALENSRSSVLMKLSPGARILQYKESITHIEQRLIHAIQTRLQQSRGELSANSQSLHAISPLATLARGYALVTEAESNTIIRSAEQVSIGQHVTARLGQGSISCIVDEIEEN